MLSMAQFKPTKPMNPATAQMQNANPSMQHMQLGASMQRMQNNTPRIAMPQMNRSIMNRF